MEQSANTPLSKGKKQFSIKQLFLGNVGTLIILLVLFAVFAIIAPGFAHTDNLMNILVQCGTNAIIAIGMTFVIISGQIDLSVGASLALASVLGGTVMVKTGNLMIGVLVVLLAGILLGVINGVLVSLCGFQPFIATLSTMWLYRGLAYVYSNGQAVTGLPQGIQSLVSKSTFILPNVVWLIVICYLICYLILSRSTLGRKIYAVGDNAEASRLSGINVRLIKVFVFAFSGFMAALSGVVLMSRLNSSQPIAGQSFEMYAIAAAVIGGASLTKGGIGGVLGTLIGAIFIATLQYGLTYMNVSSFWQQVCMGLVVLFAIAIDKLRKNLE